MSFTLYTANPNALIPQSGRTVDTFPSGLVRVSQTYLGRTANAAAHRATLAVGNNMPGGDSSPCIDGLKIFPEVQERRREDGMTEFIVSAYGRANTTGTVVFNWDVFQATATFGGVGYTGIFKQKVKKIQKVLLKPNNYDFNSDVSGVDFPILIDGYNAAGWTSRWDVGVSNYDSQNYGNFEEITVVVKPYSVVSL